MGGDPLSLIKDGYDKAQVMLDMSRGWDEVRGLDAKVDAISVEWLDSDRSAATAKRLDAKLSDVLEALGGAGGLPDPRSLLDVAAASKDVQAAAGKMVVGGHARLVANKVLMLRLGGALPPVMREHWPTTRRRLTLMQGAALRLARDMQSVIRRNLRTEREMDAQADALREAAASGDAAFESPAGAIWLEEQWDEAEALHDRARAWRRGAEEALDRALAASAQIEAAIAVGDARHPGAGGRSPIDAKALKAFEENVEGIMRKRVLKRRGG